MQKRRNLVTVRVVSKQRQLKYGPLYIRWWEMSRPIFSTCIKTCKISDIQSGKLLRISSKSHSKEDLGISVLPLCLGSLCSSDLMSCRLRTTNCKRIIIQVALTTTKAWTALSPNLWKLELQRSTLTASSNA